MSTVKVTDDSFERDVLQSEGPVLVDGAFAEELIRTGDAPASEAVAAEEAIAAEKEGEEPPAYRFGLQPMWQRAVRGLGVVEPWLMSRRD